MMAGLEPWAQQALSVGSGLIAGVFQQLRPEFLLQERVSITDIDQQFVQPGAIFDQRHGIMHTPS